MLQTVQRTLIMTSGAIAMQVGRQFREMLGAWHGPEAVVAVVEITDDLLRPSTGLTAAIQEALRCISSTSVVAKLAEQGYTLDRVQEVALLLLVDVSPTGGEQAAQLVQQVAAVVQNHLGIETAPLLVWLAVEPTGEVAADCLSASEANRFLFSRGILALGSLNEAGLRLPDETALALSCAEALWLLIATPLRTALEWLTTQDGETALGTLGVGRWEWNVEALRHLLQKRWLSEVIDQWLSPTAAHINPVEIAHWLAAVDLLPEKIQPQIAQMGADFSVTQRCTHRPPPHLVTHSPWPWELHPLFAEMAAADVNDQEGQGQRQEEAGLCLDELLQVAGQTIQQQLQTLLDERPIAGVAHTCQWVALLAQELNRLRDGLLQEADEQRPADEALNATREEMEAQLAPLLEEWPPSAFFAWMWVALKPWKWPRLSWRYWKLHSLAQQLALVYYHQAKRRRQQTMMTTAIDAYARLEQMVGRYMSQAEEIGDMLGYLRGKIEERLETGRLETERLKSVDSVLADMLYGRLLDEPALEAATAAAAVGGLGRQLVELDDDLVLASLFRCAGQRLAGLSTYSAAHLIRMLYSTPESFTQWWQSFWEAATPLWRHDPARLPEHIRNREMDLACLCGLGVTMLSETPSDVLPPDMRHQESLDRQRLFLFRLRSGLTAAAMTR